MTFHIFAGKVGILFPLFLLVACTSSSASKWKFQETVTCSPCYNSGRIYVPPCNAMRELELMISRGGNGTEMYLNALTFKFPFNSKNHQLTRVEMDIDGAHSVFEADLLTGGQRIKLPSSIAEEITIALIEKKKVVIRSGRFETEIPTEGFVYNLNALNKIPIVSCY